ncbi:MAG: hypothetical protein EB078_00565 [Proteobacteria bacterium]|nr:hypothetical protein [Pseudomonadota bacterium]NDC23162.1 hypothetical protein [Pseudomonadota bacterium]NDD03372.1 hypothetical protein [Pseudomonadota bacterium]NDG25581.1 hypothetical protein [Pseudomonadota bacterium]
MKFYLRVHYLVATLILLSVLACSKKNTGGTTLQDGSNPEEDALALQAGEQFDSSFDTAADAAVAAGQSAQQAAQSAQTAVAAANSTTSALQLVEPTVTDALRSNPEYQMKIQLITTLEGQMTQMRTDYERKLADTSAQAASDRASLQGAMTALQAQLDAAKSALAGLIESLKPCKAGFVLFSPKKQRGKPGLPPFCISSARAAATFNDADASCKAQGASLCSSTQWLRACTSPSEDAIRTVGGFPAFAREWVANGPRLLVARGGTVNRRIRGIVTGIPRCNLVKTLTNTAANRTSASNSFAVRCCAVPQKPPGY